MIKRQLFIEKKRVEELIDLLTGNLTKIDDDAGKFTLDFDGLKVDDKSWSVWNWPQGVGLYGIFKNYKLTKNFKTLRVVGDWIDKRMIEGAPPRNVNTMAPLLTFAYMFEETRDCKFIPYLEQWAEWAMKEMPRTNEGGMEHITYGPENVNQLWDDTLMMAVLPLAKIGKLLNHSEYIEEAKYQFLIHAKYLADKKTGLWYHGWTFEENHNYAKAFWARGNSWITIAIPEIIDILDLREGDFLRTFLINLLDDQIKALEKYQDVSGMWHTLIDDPTSYLESSGTAAFAYGVLKAVHCRYIDKKYEEVAFKALRGLIKEINEDGEVQHVSVGTGMGSNLDHYRNIEMTAMPYGQSLTILALTELLISFV
ncbi:glycoside hydrolase family 88/105 protein [Lactovum miscens]|uniref:Unsaturated rhamnogalacturonyl hydrolase n=1 Tax=Lactovum miscens TaxID=190387 RepID=A0A841C5E1_9LACT|nr:glycoside hydrolase family 88 protein [Lactovum miscens]MBB5887655.1 unsaturated rhamnogalacturonyl hydrolase [Lactovum miscens]